MLPPGRVAEVSVAVEGRASDDAELRGKLQRAGLSDAASSGGADIVVAAEDEMADVLRAGVPVVVAAEVDVQAWVPSLALPVAPNVARAMRTLLTATEQAQAEAFTRNGGVVIADEVAASLADALGVRSAVLFGAVCGRAAATTMADGDDGGSVKHPQPGRSPVVVHAAVHMTSPAITGDEPGDVKNLAGADSTILLPAPDHVAVVPDLAVGDTTLPGPWALVGIAGGDLVAAALPLPVPIAGDGIDVVRVMLSLVDRGIANVRAGLELPLRVRQLDTLQQVHVAAQQRPPVHELCHRVAAAMTSGMRYRAVARCEVELDGYTAAVGADGPMQVEIAEDVVVGRRRGRVAVGYVEPRELLVPEEPLLVDAVVEWLEQYLERQESQSALAAAAERQRHILANLPSMVVTVDRNRTVHVVASGPAAPIAEGTAFSLDSLGSLVPDVDTSLRDVIEDLVRHAMDGTASHWQETVWSDRWWQLRFEPFQRAGDGTVTQALGMAVDITERRRATELESRLAALVDGAHVGVIGIGLDGTITDWNEGATRILGWSPHEVVGRPIGVIETGLPSVPRVADRLEQIRTSGQDLPYLEAPRRHRDGHHVDVGISVAAVKSGDGDTPIGLSAIMLDLTERNRALEAMEISERHVRLLADHAHDVVYRVRVDPSRMEYISPSTTKVLGYAPSEFYEQPDLFEDRTHPDDAGLLVQDSAGRLNAKVRVRWQHADGRWRWLEDRRTPVVENGVVVGATGIVRDITDDERAKETMRAALAWERRAADQLRQLDDLKTAFLSAVSHEVRTPLTSVLGFSETALRVIELVRDQAAEAEDAGRGTDGTPIGSGEHNGVSAVELADRIDPLLDRVVVNAHRLERLVNDLLDVDRLTRGDVSPRRHRVEIHTLVARALERDHLGGRRLVADLRPVVLDVDPVMIDRAVDNLIRNAARHTRPRATVWVRCHPTSAGARIVVEDDGDGVPTEFRERVFQPFQQGPGIDGKQSQGTGIGLSLVRQFVEIHGGEVTLEERPGGGARFVVDLPAHSPRDDASGGVTPP